jgi:DNA topoisomerase VI subunit B
MPAKTIESILDYSKRVSSREAYVSPTRGAQGNALKTILAMPYVLSGEKQQGEVEIGTQGKLHQIVFGVDRIRQEPKITHKAIPAKNVKNGTFVKVYLAGSKDEKSRFLQIADDYTFLNPHLTLTVDWFGSRTTIKATNPKWSKWLPSDQTSPHWYQVEDFERLVSAYITSDQDRGADRLVREFVAEFRGLHGSAKGKTVLEETGLTRTNLSALANGHGLEHEIIGKLLKATQKHSKPVKPAALGVIGEDHLRTRFQEVGCEMETFQYKKVAAMDSDGLPMVVESAFAWRGEQCAEPRRIITGINWSPAIGNPFRTLGTEYGAGLAALLEKKYAGNNEPIVFLLHCAHPRVRYTDRGKSAVVMK